MDDDESSSDITSQELFEWAREHRPINTNKSTTYALNVWKKWAEKRKGTSYVCADILTYQDDTELSRAMFKFFGELRSDEGREYTPSSLLVIRSGLQRYLTITSILRQI